MTARKTDGQGFTVAELTDTVIQRGYSNLQRSEKMGLKRCLREEGPEMPGKNIGPEDNSKDSWARVDLHRDASLTSDQSLLWYTLVSKDESAVSSDAHFKVKSDYQDRDNLYILEVEGGNTDFWDAIRDQLEEAFSKDYMIDEADGGNYEARVRVGSLEESEKYLEGSGEEEAVSPAGL